MSPIPLGIFAVAGASGAAAGAFDLVSTSLLASDTATVSFDISSLASSYKHLQFRCTILAADDTGGAYMKFNNVSNVYAIHRITADGSSVAGQGSASNTAILIRPVETRGNDDNAYSGHIIDIADFAGTKNKVVRQFGGKVRSGSSSVQLGGALWPSTSSTSTISFSMGTGNIASGSVFSLYGIKG